MISVKKKILFIVISIFVLIFSIYSIIEIDLASQNFRKDFDQSLKNTMMMLLPSLSLELYDLEVFTTQQTLKTVFSNPVVIKTVIFDENGKYFSGYQRLKEGSGIKKMNEKDNSLAKHTVTHFQSAAPAETQISLPVNLKIVKEEKRRFFFLSIFRYDHLQNKQLKNGYLLIETKPQFIAVRAHHMALRFASGISVTLFFSIVLLYLFLNRIVVQPIQKMSEASIKIANGLFEKVEVPQKLFSDEVTTLSKNFNCMAEKLEGNIQLLVDLKSASEKLVKCKTLQEIQDRFFQITQELMGTLKSEIFIKILAQKKSTHPYWMNLQSQGFFAQEEFSYILNPEKKHEIREENGRSILLSSLGREKQVIVKVTFSSSDMITTSLKNIFENLLTSLETALQNYWHWEAEKKQGDLKKEMELAGALQDSILGKEAFNCAEFSCHSFYQTATQCGGDWFGSYLINDHKLLVLLGDVSGHGTPAALLTAVARGSVDMFVRFCVTHKMWDELQPSKILSSLNENIWNTGNHNFAMTMIAGLFDFQKKKVVFANAGQTHPLIFSPEKSREPKFIVPPSGSILGLEEQARYADFTIVFPEGSHCLFYTDGLVEGKNPHNVSFGTRRLKKIVQEYHNFDGQKLIKNITENAFQFYESVPLSDDVTLYCVTSRGKANI